MRERLMRGSFLLALACLALSGCDAQSSGRATIAAATATATTMHSATATSTSTPTSSLTPAPLPLYTCEQTIPQGGHVTQIGDLRLSDVSLDHIGYPGVMLPDNTSLTKPYQLHAEG